MSAQADSPQPTVGDFAAVLRRHRRLIMLCVLSAVGLGLAYTFYARPVYEATSVVRFEVDRVDLPQLVEQLASENMISTELAVLHGRNAALAVVDSLGLRARLLVPRRAHRTDLFALLRVVPAADSGTFVVRNNSDGKFTVTRPGSARILAAGRTGDTIDVEGIVLALTAEARHTPELQLRIDLPDDAVGRFQSRVKVTRPGRDVDLIAIRAEASDPNEAAAIANLLATNIISGRQAFQKGRTNSTTVFLQEQAENLRTQLRTAEDSLRAYQEREHVVDVPEQARSQVARLAELQANLAVMRADRDAFGRLIEQLRQDTAAQSPGDESPSRRFMAFPTLLQNQSASVLLGALAQAEAQRSELLIRRLPADADVQVLTARIRQIEAQLQGIAESFQQSLANQVASLQSEAGRFRKQLDELPEKELQTARRERDARVLNDLSVLVQTRLKEAEITGSVGDPTVRLVDTAVPPPQPTRPSVPINVALSLILGTMVGITGAFARSYGDKSVRSRADALAAAGLPVLGAIPRVSQRRFAALLWQRSGPRDDMAPLLVTRSGNPPAYVESYKQLFANLGLAHRQHPLKVAVFTSPLPGEGKTLSAINFALVGTSRGLRVALIDADLRCGVVSSVLGCARGVGFADLLAGTSQLSEASRQVSVGDHALLTVIPSGVFAKGAGRFLTIERVNAVLKALAPSFDLVVIDTPPVNLLADAALLGSAADAVLVVIRAGHTQVDDLRYAMEQLESAGAPVLGTLLNDIDLRKNKRDDGSYRYVAEAGRYAVVSS